MNKAKGRKAKGKGGPSPSAAILMVLSGGLLLLMIAAFVSSIPDLVRYFKIRSM